MRPSRTECLLLLTWLTTAALAQDPLPKNCFSFVDESQWSRVLGFNSTSASLSVLVEGAGSSVQTCLRYTFIQTCKFHKAFKSVGLKLDRQYESILRYDSILMIR